MTILRSTVLLLILFMTMQSSRAQPTAAKMRWYEKHHKTTDDDCIFTNKYTLSQRLSRYPFKDAVKIIAVSYHCMNIPRDNDTSAKQRGGLIIRNGVLDSSTLVETRQLTKKQIQQLTNIIYNTAFRRTVGFNIVDHGACYEPRNSLLFIDKDGKVFDYLDICFQCKEYHSGSEELTIGTVCSQKFSLMKKYFIGLGIKTGTVID